MDTGSYLDRSRPVYYAGAGAERVAAATFGKDGGAQRSIIDVKTGRILSSAPMKAVQSVSNDLMTEVDLWTSGWSTRLTTGGLQPHIIAKTNPGWADRPIGEVRSLAYKVGDRALTGWMILPPGHRPGVRLPAIVWIYGGTVFGLEPPRDAAPSGSTTPLYNGQLLAGRGYAVLYPSTPIGRGADSDMMAALANETVALVDAASAAGVVDADRVGIIGHSFGGYSTAAVLARQSEGFRAGIAMDGVYDIAAAWGQRSLNDILSDRGGVNFDDDTTIIEGAQLGMGEPFWHAPGAYALNSPINAVDQIRAPLMLMQSDLDLGATSLIGAERMYAALKRAGNDAVLVRYWGEGHVQLSESVVRDEWSRMLRWFDHYVKP